MPMHSGVDHGAGLRLSPSQAEYAEYLRHALCRTLGCDAVADRGLSGRQVEALKDLVLAPSWTPELIAAVISDRPSVAGKNARNTRDTSERSRDAVVEEFDEPSLVQGVSKRLRVGDPVPRDRPALLEHISIRVYFYHDKLAGHVCLSNGELRSFTPQVKDPQGSQVLKVTLNGPDALQGIRDMARGGLLTEPPRQLRDLVLGTNAPSNDITLVLGTK